LGERPVRLPVRVTSAPELVKSPSAFLIAASARADTLRFISTGWDPSTPATLSGDIYYQLLGLPFWLDRAGDGTPPAAS
jgi:hypothetical protein